MDNIKDNSIELENILFNIDNTYVELTRCFYCNKIYNVMTDEYVVNEKIINNDKIKKNGLCKTCFMDLEQNQETNKV
jgi:hypothetical protein